MCLKVQFVLFLLGMAHAFDLWDPAYACNPENSFQCKSTGHCLPKSFICDGESDCIDNSDETAEECVNKETCKGQFQFQCVSKECIDLHFVCDKKVDCVDGWSDEMGCPIPHPCNKEEGEFLCKSGDLCIPRNKVCNKKDDCPDKSDEFLGCENSCLNTNCSQGCLPDSQRRGVGSGFCYCFPGYTHHGGGECEDVDECKFFGACSQKCTNLMGSYQCSCLDGFRLVGNSSCELVENNATLVFVQGGSVRVHTTSPDALESSQNYTLVESQGSPISVTFDARNGWVYWSDVQDQDEAIWRSKLDGTQKEKVVTTGLVLPEGIAYDWIANNIYFTDSNMSHIVVCTGNGGNCSVIIQELSKPRDLALHPNLGLLYWTDWGITPSIMKAGMDGSIPVAVIMDNLKWPNGIVIDQGNDRIYWTDAGMDRMETATLEGDDRLIVHSNRINHPFGIDVLGDYVYWSDWNLREIQKTYKFNGSNHQTLVKEGHDQFNGLTIFHKANQPKSRKNQCQDAGCSHICTLTPKNSYRCHCPVGMYLDKKNNTKCAVNETWPKFVVGYNNTLKISPIDAIGGNTFQEFVIPTLGNIVAIATVPFNTTLFLSDFETHKIYSFDTKTKVLTTIVDSVGFAKGMDYDEIGNNLYWVDSTRKTVEVMSLKTRTRVVLFKEIDRPIDIVVVPSLRMLFLAEKSDRGAKFVRMNMNGFNRRVIYRKPRSDPVALTYSVELKQLFWTDDAFLDTIHSIGINGCGGEGISPTRSYPFGITSFGSTIYWVDRHAHTLEGKNPVKYSERGIFIGHYETMRKGHVHDYTISFMAKVTIMNNPAGITDQLRKGHECSAQKNNCSHICLLAADDMEGTCVCPANFKLDNDALTCVALSKNDTPRPVICSEGRCQNKTTATAKTPSTSSKPSLNPTKDTVTSNDKVETETATSRTASSSSESSESLEDASTNEAKHGDRKSTTPGSGRESRHPHVKPHSDFGYHRDDQGLEYDEYDGSEVTFSPEETEQKIDPPMTHVMIPLGILAAIAATLAIIGVTSVIVIFYRRHLHRYLSQPSYRVKYQSQNEGLVPCQD